MRRISGIARIDSLLSSTGYIDVRRGCGCRLLAEEDCCGVIGGIRCNEVEEAIVIEISDSDVVDAISCGRRLLRTECAITDAREDGDLSVVRQDEIEFVVVIDIDQGRLDSAIAAVIEDWATERAVAIAEIDEDGRAIQIGRDQIDDAIMTKAASAENAGCIPKWKAHSSLGLECAIAVTQQDADGAVVLIGNSEIGVTVLVEIGDCNTIWAAAS